MLRLLQILTIFTFFSCNHENKKIEKKPSANNYFIERGNTKNDTLPNGKRLFDNRDSMMFIHYREVVGSDTLKDGYITCYAIDDTCRYFYLRHGDSMYLLSKTDWRSSSHSLGVFFKDFDRYLMTVFDHGNGFPETYQVYDKTNGRSVIGSEIEAASYKIYNGELFLLYDNSCDGRLADSITLVNVTARSRQGYKLPDSMPKYLDIRIEKLTKEKLTISYSAYIGYTGDKVKTYSR